MGLGHSPSIVVDGLVFMIDPNNTNCYSGFGNTVYNLVNPSIGGTFVGYTSNPIDNTENRSIYFDGSNDYIQFPNAVSDTLQSFTLETVVKTTATNQKQAFMSTYASNLGWGIEVLDNTNSNKINFFGFTSAGVFTGVLSTVSVSTNSVYHLTAVYTASNSLALYVNGVFNNSVSTGFTSLSKSASANLRLGDDPDAQSVYFQGNMFLSKIYNRALTSTEILQNYNATKKKYDPDENIVTNGLVLHIDPSKNTSYPGTGNTIYDLSGSGNTGTLTNGPTFSALNGGSIAFDGSNDYVTIGDKLDLGLNSYTFSCWFKLNSVSGYQCIFSKSIATNVDNRYALYISNNKLQSFLQGNQGLTGPDVDITSSVTLVTGTWYHVTSVYDRSGTLKLYVNGVSDSSATISQWQNVNIDSSYTFKIGAYATSGNEPTFFTNGNITSFTAYNRALSAQEILQNYNATKNRFVNALPPVRNGLVLELDAANRASYSGTGNTWYDLSGNNLNGTLTNGPTFSGIGATSSIVFDKTNDYVTLGDSSLLNTFTGMALEVIVKYTSTTDQIIAQKVNYSLNHWYGIEIYSSTIAAACYQGGANYLNVAVSSYPANNVYHMVITLNGTTQTLYINGVSVASNSSGALPSLSGTNFVIGARSNISSPYLGGNVYLTKFYNRALSAYEIKQNFDFYRTRYNI